ncbi:MAG: hypothetical protein AAFQ94_06755 [Bacteroidota bacterium]
MKKNIKSITSLTLVLILGIFNYNFSQVNNKNMPKQEKMGLLVILKAKAGKEKEVENFLLSGLSLVNNEPQTEAWFAFRIDESTFGIYDTFDAEEGRQAHLSGEVAKALLANADNLLEDFSVESSIQPIDLVANRHKAGTQKKGLLVIMNAKQGKSTDVESFLMAGKNLVAEEPKTLSWYAFRIDENTYGIFDTFAAEEGRDAHLTGKVAAALMENAPTILEGFEASAIQKIDILASK